MPGRGAWWARNRAWVALLLPLVLLAVAASSFRLTRIWLPWNFTRPVVASGTSMTFHEDFVVDVNKTLSRTVDISVLAVEPVPSLDGRLPAPGATLHRVDLRFAADPDVILRGCTIELVGPDGTEYNATSGQVDAPGTTQFSNPDTDCVPFETPGPTWDGFSNTIEPAEVERPRNWTRSVAVAIPSTVEPAQVRIQWQAPNYVLLEIPR